MVRVQFQEMFRGTLLRLVIIACLLFTGCATTTEDYSNRGTGDIERPVKSDIDLAKAYFERGNTYADKGQYDQAILYYGKTLEITPRSASTYINRGQAYSAKGQYDRAISDYNKALEINPRYAKAYNNRGIAYRAKSEYDRAISDYNKAVEINPRYGAAYLNRGNVYSIKANMTKPSQIITGSSR